MATAAEIKVLRERTGAGLLACKKALEESDGNMEAAIDLLRKKGEAKAAKKADRATNEGFVSIDGAAIVAVQCETDFVARNEKFRAFVDELAAKASESGPVAAKEHFESVKGEKIMEIGENLQFGEAVVVEGAIYAGYVHTNGKVGAIVALDGGTEEMAKDVAMHVVAMNPSVANPEDVAQEEIDREIAIYKEQLIAEGKPENIMDNIIAGKVKKYCAGQALTCQTFVKDSSMTVQEYLGDNKLTAFIRMAA